MHLFVVTLVRKTMIYLLVALTLVACSETGPSEPEAKGTQPRMRLITTDQYVNTLMYVSAPAFTRRENSHPQSEQKGY